MDIQGKAKEDGRASMDSLRVVLGAQGRTRRQAWQEQNEPEGQERERQVRLAVVLFREPSEPQQEHGLLSLPEREDALRL